MQHYILVVQAQDTGRPSLSSTVTVYFNVQDLNDNAPIFDPMSYSDEVFENITVGSSVLSVSATDQDSGKCTAAFHSLEGDFKSLGLESVLPLKIYLIMVCIFFEMGWKLVLIQLGYVTMTIPVAAEIQIITIRFLFKFALSLQRISIFFIVHGLF